MAQIQVNPDQDTYIQEAAPSAASGSDAAIEMLVAGSGTTRQGLIRFDLSGIPAGSTVTSASLDVFVLDQASAIVSFHKMISSWTEASTWTSMGGGVSTDNSEAETTADVADNRTWTVSTTQTVTIPAAAIQDWVDGQTNNGWLLLQSSANLLEFASNNHATPANRPLLTVNYDPPASLEITDVGTDEIIDDLQQNVTITGTGFHATSNTVEIGDNSTYASATKVTLPIDSQGTTSIVVDFQNATGGTAISEALLTRPLYLFVTPSGGSPSAAFPITLNDSDPYLESLDTGLSIMSGLTPGTKPADMVLHGHGGVGSTLQDRWRTLDFTLVNAPTIGQTALPSTATRANAVLFATASDQYATRAHAAAMADATGAIAGWCKVGTLVDNTIILSKNGSTPAEGDILLEYDANGQVTFTVWNATPTALTIQSATGYLSEGQTFHFCIEFDGSGFRLKLDGNEVGTAITSYTAGLASNTREMRLAKAGA